MDYKFIINKIENFSIFSLIVVGYLLKLLRLLGYRSKLVFGVHLK